MRLRLVLAPGTYQFVAAVGKATESATVEVKATHVVSVRWYVKVSNVRVSGSPNTPYSYVFVDYEGHLALLPGPPRLLSQSDYPICR